MKRINFLKKKHDKQLISTQVSVKKQEIKSLKRFMKELNRERKLADPNAKTLRVNIDVDFLKAGKDLAEAKEELKRLRKERISNFFRRFTFSRRAKKVKEKASY